jgi:hypothetical protein
MAQSALDRLSNWIMASEVAGKGDNNLSGQLVSMAGFFVDDVNFTKPR